MDNYIFEYNVDDFIKFYVNKFLLHSIGNFIFCNLCGYTRSTLYVDYNIICIIYQLHIYRCSTQFTNAN